jgi:UDP-GlcNAc:undecaprenyl-phosphate/decaprenyl-phosphate GlcNAc-1-phosphate transferase
MDIPFSSLLIASITSYIAIVILRPFAISINLLDIPNNRKPHDGKVPLIGGIAIFIGIVVSILSSSNDLNQYNIFLLTSLILIMIGVLDDHQNISIQLRLIFQLLVSMIIVTTAGISIESLGNLLGNGEIFLNNWSYFISIIVIIAAINAVNMADGIHGLAGGSSLITFSSIIFLSFTKVSYESIEIAFLFCAVLPIFLIQNLCIGMSKSNRIFMGDAGSMFIGMSIAWILIDLTQGEGQVFSPVTALWLFGLPIIEMATTIFRRLSYGKSPFKSDLFHSHHLLIRIGIDKKNTLLLMLLASLLFSLIGILGEKYGVTERVMFFAFILLLVIYIILHSMVLKKIQNTDD